MPQTTPNGHCCGASLMATDSAGVLAIDAMADLEPGNWVGTETEHLAIILAQVVRG